jgi:hypothetical protein
VPTPFDPNRLIRDTLERAFSPSPPLTREPAPPSSPSAKPPVPPEPLEALPLTTFPAHWAAFLANSPQPKIYTPAHRAMAELGYCWALVEIQRAISTLRSR